MRKLLLLFFVTSSALAQPAFIYESSPVNRTDKMGTMALTDISGRLQCVMPASATSIAKNIDSAVGATDTGALSLSIRDDAGATKTSTAGDAQGLYTNPKGALYVDYRYGWQSSAADGLLKQEDAVSSSGDAGVVPLVYYRTSAQQSAGTTGDYSFPINDADGRLYVNAYGAGSGEFFQSCGTATATTADVAIKAAVASNRIYVTAITCSNSSATVASNLNFKDATTVIAVGGVSQMATASAGSFTATFPVPLRGSVNTAFNFNTAVSVSSVVCCATGYISPN